MARVVLEHVSKSYHGPRAENLAAVTDLNLAIADREFLVLVGPSGCGKSTTLRMIAGLEELTQGKIWMDDRLINDLEPKDRDVAMVFQNYALYPHMTVYENLGFALKLGNTRKPPSRSGFRKWRGRWDWRPASSASRALCRAGNASESPWAAPLRDSRKPFCLMNLFQTSMPGCEVKCAWNFPASTSASPRP